MPGLNGTDSPPSILSVMPINLSNASSKARWIHSTVDIHLRFAKNSVNALHKQSVTAQHSLKACVDLSQRLMLPRETIKSS